MLTKINKNIILILILILAFFIRSYHLDSYPPLNPDEAAIGYNAYSLLLTGKDEHGASWPIHFESFGDYKPGGYFYLVLPFVKLFGLNVLSVRLPNLILSLLTLYFFYQLLYLLSENKSLSLLSAFLLAINPWHIHFSRGGWESNAALSFILIGTFFFFKYLKDKKIINFFIFVLLFVASLYIYHSARLIAPLLAFTYLSVYFSKIKVDLKKIVLPVVFGILISIPLLISFFNNGGASRFSGVGLTADQGPLWRSNELLNQHFPLTYFDRIIHNKRVLYLLSWGQKYFSHFDLNYLFISGDDVPRSKVPDMGQFYLLELPFLFIGIIFLPRSKIFDRQSKFIILSWVLITPLASSLTFQAPSALRALSMVIPLIILISLGLYEFFKYLFSFKNKYLLIIGYCSLFTFYLYSFLYYLDAYFIQYQKLYPDSWTYGFSQLVPYIEFQKNNFSNIFITNKYDQPYILFLFFSHYPPSLIQTQIKLTPKDQYGFSTVLSYDNYHFSKIDWNNIPVGSLVVAADESIPSTPKSIINFPNGSPAFKIYTK